LLELHSQQFHLQYHPSHGFHCPPPKPRHQQQPRIYGGITRLTCNRSLKLSGGVDIGIDREIRRRRIGGHAPYLAYQTT
jgi:hypothetical protein